MLEKAGRGSGDRVMVEEYLRVAGVFAGDQVDGLEDLDRAQAHVLQIPYWSSYYI
jgi:antirestriction protein ArdC